MADPVTLLSSRRSEAFSNSVPQEGRLKGNLELRLTDELPGGSTTTIGVTNFHFLAARDVAALGAGLILKRCPDAGAHDAETTKLVHVDLADPDLPWRYTPEPTQAAPGKNRPWLALIVGKASEFEVAGGVVTKGVPDILKLHPLAESARWAHLQREPGGREISRLVSPYMDQPADPGDPPGSPGQLSPFQRYRAAIVPTFNDQGDAWNTTGNLNPGFPENALPVFDSWEFTTGASGDFESLAAKLHLQPTGEVGKIALHYRSLTINGQPATATLRGAITALDDDPGAIPAVVTQDLDILNNPLADEGGLPHRDIVGLPQYGRPWVEQPNEAPPGWAKALNDDPRYRAIAGMGTWLGIEAQEELMAAGVEQAGALQDVAHRCRQLALGVELSTRLWNRRLPDDPAQRLEVFGPGLGRMLAANDTTVLQAVTQGKPALAKQSTLAAAQFASAAARMLRNGTARTRHVADRGKINRAALLRAAAKAPPRPERTAGGLPHADNVLATPIFSPPLAPKVLRLVAEADRQALDAGFIAAFVNRLAAAGFPGDECVRRKLTGLIGQVSRVTRGLLLRLVQSCQPPFGSNVDFPPEITGATPGVPPDRFIPVNIDILSGKVADVLDPRAPDSPARQRVQDTIANVTLGDLAPPELPLGLNFPTWQLVNKYARDWLIPGVGSVPEHSVVSLRTNPTFVDAFLVALNAQFLAEARWRNLRVQRKFTPLRMFWGQINPATGSREADIQPLATWAKDLAKGLGDKAHQVIDPRDASGKKDLVVLFRTELFRRYPGTLVYLMEKPATDDDLKRVADFTPAAAPIAPQTHAPIFVGNVTADVVFFIFNIDPDTLSQHWLMIDEPPAELRFRKLPYAINPAGGLTPVQDCLDRPTRVAMDGAYLKRKGLL